MIPWSVRRRPPQLPHKKHLPLTPMGVSRSVTKRWFSDSFGPFLSPNHTLGLTTWQNLRINTSNSFNPNCKIFNPVIFTDRYSFDSLVILMPRWVTIWGFICFCQQTKRAGIVSWTPHRVWNFSKQSVEERRHLGPVSHGPYVPLRSEPSESVTAWEFFKTQWGIYIEPVSARILYM